MQTFSTSTFQEQKSALDASLVSRESYLALLSESASLPDAEPLAYLLRLLAEHGLLREDPEIKAALFDALSRLPDANIAKVLRSLERLPEVTRDAAMLTAVIGAAAQVIQEFPIERVAAICFLDRWLKNISPDTREQLCAQAARRIQEQIAENNPDEISPRDLLLLTTDRTQQLTRLAISLERGWWDARLSQFAQQILSILASAPKSLSQANAEELLSKRVYTDPGHFFIELLQNTEDAKARTWSVSVQPDTVSLWHDGKLFDAKDVVGVLSIGQTTKMKGQIGFFGVGFKSVYEVTDRPQIYSGPYLFEIADVSLPKRLSQRPEGAPPEGTLLRLPLRPEHKYRELYQRLLKVPPQTLLMLDSLQEMALSCGEHSRTTKKTSEVLRAPHAPENEVSHVTIASLIEQESEQRESFFIENARGHRFSFDGDREASRADKTPALIAVLLDKHQLPTPLPEGADTIFSYLPTKEQSGLRFLFHAHFDLPVDRERLHLSSPWNRWALTLAAELLLQLMDRLHHQQHWAALRAMLSIIPLPEDSTHPAFQEIARAFQRGSLHKPLLPGAAEERLSPVQSCIVEDASLLPFLRGLELLDQKRPLARLTPREEKLARSLGVASFGQAELVSFLEAQLNPITVEGIAVASEGWLSTTEALDALLHSLGSIRDSSLQERVRALPLLRTEQGVLYRSDLIFRGSDELRAIYHKTRAPFIARSLEQTSSRALERLFSWIGCKALQDEDLLRDLREDTEKRRQLLSTQALLWEHLSSLNLQKTSSLASLPLFEGEDGRFWSLSGDPRSIAYLPPEGELSGWLSSLSNNKPRLLCAELLPLRAFFLRLGASELGLTTILYLIQNESFQIETNEALSLHPIIDEMRQDLTSKVSELLVKSKIFPDRSGVLRALDGEDAAYLAEDEEIVELSPSAPWISSSIASLAYLRLLRISEKGVNDVAAVLVSGGALFDRTDVTVTRRAYLYLLRRVRRMSQMYRESMSRAPMWLSTSGALLSLADLRQAPSTAHLQALYSRWSTSSLIDDDALALVSALDLNVTPIDHNTLLNDLLRSPPDMQGELRPLVLAALEEASRVLPRAELLAVRQAKIFGASQPLGTWEIWQSGGCLRANGEHRALLQYSTVSLLPETDEADFASLLSVIGDRLATIADTCEVAAHEIELWSDEPRRMLLSLLVRERAQLAGIKAKLQPMPIWPTSEGEFLAANLLVRASALRQWLGDETWAEGERLLAKEAEADAEALQSIFTFKAPLDIVLQKIRSEIQIGALLSEQRPMFSTINTLSRIFVLLSRSMEVNALFELPLWIDNEQRLQRGPKLASTLDETILLSGLEKNLADETWHQALSHYGLSQDLKNKLVPSLTARKVLALLADESSTTLQAAEHPRYQRQQQRARLYGWIFSRAQEIEEDPQALGLLGRACVILAPSGALRSPRDFLFMQEPEGLSLDWSPHEEIPAVLIQWLRRVFRVEEQRLNQVVQKLLEAHEEAITARQLDRSAPLLRALSNVLQSSNAGDLPSLVERLRVVKTLRVESETGEITKPKKLFATSTEKWGLLRAFMTELPERPAARYHEESIIALLRAAGAKADLSREDLQRILAVTSESSLDKLLALSRYMGLLLTEEASLVRELSLDKLAWLPDGEGHVRAPRELYWPTPDIQAALGDAPSLFAHPEFFLTMPLEIQQKLSFRTLQTANPEDIAERIGQLSTVSVELLRWLQQALQERRVEVAWVRALFQDKPLLVDEFGVARRPGELLRESARELFGARRAVWPDAQKFPRLADAIGIPPYVGRKEVMTFLEEIAKEDLNDILDREPTLRTNLPNCLSFLSRSATKNEPASLLPLLVDDKGVQRVCLSSHPNVRLPEPEELYEKAKSEGQPLLFVVLPEEGRDEVIEWLKSIGIKHLGDVSKATTADEKKGLFSRIRQLWNKDEQEERQRTQPQEEAPPPPKHKPGPTRAPNPTEGQPTPQSDWMRPRNAIGEQLRGSPNWVESRARPPVYGFSFAPKDLPPPYRYAPMLIADRFDPRSQRWSRDAVQNIWEQPARSSANMAVFKGKLAAGESILPMPLYGRLLRIDTQEEVRQLVTRDGQSLIRCVKDTSLSYDVALDEAPEFIEGAPSPSVPALQKKTVPDEDLPQEVHSFLLQLKGAPGLQKALEIRDFIRERYRYDPSYLEDPEVARWLRQVSYNSANMHITALHAGRDAKHLGRGVCYELNALACELMRRTGVPSAVVTGWTLERGSASEPDHMWSVALLESNVGPRWLPIDASTTRDGRPLRVAQRPAGPWRAKAPNTELPKAPRWMEGRGGHQRSNLPTAELFAVVRHLANLSGQGNLDEEKLAKKCRDILQDKEAAKRLLEMLRAGEEGTGNG
jgi:transglutaminase-like putative cysteine protease